MQSFSFLLLQIIITFKWISLHQDTLKKHFLPVVTPAFSLCFLSHSVVFTQTCVGYSITVWIRAGPVFASNRWWLCQVEYHMGGVCYSQSLLRWHMCEPTCSKSNMVPERCSYNHQELDQNIWFKVCDGQTASSESIVGLNRESRGHCVGCCAALQTQWGACVMALPLGHALSRTHAHTQALRHSHNLLIFEISTYRWGSSAQICTSSELIAFLQKTISWTVSVYTRGMICLVPIQLNSLTAESSGEWWEEFSSTTTAWRVKCFCRFSFAYIHMYTHRTHIRKCLPAHTHTISKGGQLPEKHGWDQQLRVFRDVLLKHSSKLHGRPERDSQTNIPAVS